MPHVRYNPELVEFHRKRIERLRNLRDLPAPWEVYPDVPYGSIGWRMGPGEDVIGDWRCFLNALTPEEREVYRRRHPEPEPWRQLVEHLLERFTREAHGKTWDQYWDAEFEKQREMWGSAS